MDSLVRQTGFMSWLWIPAAWSWTNFLTWKPQVPHLWNGNNNRSYFVWVLGERKECICSVVGTVLRRGQLPTKFSSSAAGASGVPGCSCFFPNKPPSLLTLRLPTGQTSNAWWPLSLPWWMEISPPPWGFSHRTEGETDPHEEDSVPRSCRLANLRLSRPCFCVPLVAFYAHGSGKAR